MMFKKIIQIIPFILIFCVSLLLFYVLLDQNNYQLVSTSQSPFEERGKKQKLKREDLLPILLYHNINGKGRYAVTSEKLEEHFLYFQQEDYQVVPLNPRLTYAKSNKKKVAISFDDGFFSMYTELLPLVKKYQYPITLFVYTDFITKNNHARTMLSWAKLRELEANGVDVQCHSKTHADLLELTKQEKTDFQLYQEIYLTKRVCELYLRKEINLFAYPYGAYNWELVHLCQLAGYERVYTTDFGSNYLVYDNYVLKRHHVLKFYSLEKIKRIIK